MSLHGSLHTSCINTMLIHVWHFAMASSRVVKRVRELDHAAGVSPSKMMRKMVPSWDKGYNRHMMDILISVIDNGLEEFMEGHKEENPCGVGKVAIDDFERARRDGHIIRIQFVPQTKKTGIFSSAWSLFASVQIDDAPTPIEALRPYSGGLYDLMMFDGQTEPSEAAKLRHTRIKKALETFPDARSEYNKGFLELFVNLGYSASLVEPDFGETADFASPEGSSLAMAHLVAAGFEPEWFNEPTDQSEFTKLCVEYAKGLKKLTADTLPMPAKIQEWEPYMCNKETDNFLHIGKSDAAAALRFGKQVGFRFVPVFEFNREGEFVASGNGDWVVCE